MDKKNLEKRLQELGIYDEFWNRTELKPLAQLIDPKETLECIFTGVHEGNRKMVAITDKNVIILATGLVTSGNVNVLSKGAVTEHSYEKGLIFAKAHLAGQGKSWDFVNCQKRMKEMFDKSFA